MDKQTYSSVQTSPAAAGSATYVFAKDILQWDAIDIDASLQGATGGTLDVHIQRSYDGTEWRDYVHFDQLAPSAASVKYSVSPTLDGQIYTVGSGTTPVLAAGTCANGHWGDQLRVLMVAGTDTSAGAEQTIKVYAWQRKI